MNLTESARILFVVIVIILALTVLSGCQQQKFSLERVPQEYRSCASQVVPALASGRPITQKELIEGYAALKRYAGTQNRCLRGLIKWADAQHSAYYRSF